MHVMSQLDIVKMEATQQHVITINSRKRSTNRQERLKNSIARLVDSPSQLARTPFQFPLPPASAPPSFPSRGGTIKFRLHLLKLPAKTLSFQKYDPLTFLFTNCCRRFSSNLKQVTVNFKLSQIIPFDVM